MRRQLPWQAPARYREQARFKLDAAELALEEADLIVSAGNGVHDLESFHALATALGAAVGASRVPVDDGRFPRSQQIGATGKTVSASLYLAFGISGAVQHLQGIKDCRHVIAVNLDASAPLIKRADLSIIDDAHSVTRALLDEVARAREAARIPWRRPMAEPRIAVLVSLGRHPVSGAVRWSRNDGAALALARRLGGASVAVLHAGDPDEPALRGYLALGAPCVQTIDVPRDRDVLDPLAALLSDYALVLCGSRGESGMGSGLLPHSLAQRLGRPLLPNVLSAQLASGAVRARQFRPRADAATWKPTCPRCWPCIPPRPSNHAMPMRGERRARTARCGARPGRAAGRRLAHRTGRRAAAQLAAPERRSGRDRLLAATAMASRGGEVIQHGSPEDKARAVLAYLRTHNLVDY